MSPELYFALCLGVLGLLIGSFLNVVIARVPHGDSIVSPPSHCPKCGHQLRWFENVPVFSWVLLRGRCGECREPISARYLFVELLTCVLFLGCLRQFGWSLQLVQALTFVTLLVPLVFIDLEHWILPFELTLPGVALGVLLQAPLGWAAVQTSMIGAAAGFLAFRALEFFGWLALRKETLGAGDKFLLAMIGAFLGWKPLFGVIALSSLQGAVVGLVMLKVTGRAGPKVRGDEAGMGGPEATTPGEPKPEEPKPAEPAPPETPVEAQPRPEAAGSPLTPALSPRPQGEGAREEEDAGDEPLPFTPLAFEPGLPVLLRLYFLPETLLWQPIPDEPEVYEPGEPEWVPGDTNLPFGPWIGLAGLEVLLLRPFLEQADLPRDLAYSVSLLFGLAR